MTRFPRPHRVGVLLAVIGLLGGVLLWGLGLHTSAVRDLLPSWVTLVPLAVMSFLELLRRSCPRTALLASTVAVIANEFTDGNLATILMYTDLMYAAVVYGTPGAARRIPVITGLITVAMTIAALAWLRRPEALLIGVVTGLVSFGPALTGATLRNHRQAAEAARLRAEQTALLAEIDRAQAVTAERSRMARELHDMVANNLSAIAIHSTAALSIDEPGASAEALAVIRENSVQGLSEMRRLIGLLRDTSGDQEPAVAPSLDGLDALVAQVRTVGADSGLVFVLDDTRAPGVRLPAPVEMAAYRIVQESLTNALKHASPGPVTVTLTHRDHTLTVGVSSAYGDRPGPRAPGSGAGLVGMRERVTLLDGTLEAGPVTAADGTKIWQVRARLPAEDDTELYA
ncbi:two-component sensor histidine kinase [Streptomyces agglomeratus]|uniref:sensor histidine kinase n=1 Tax=Streptomyces agglomeratus TaxID=285458 RepID=UPI000854A77E|nr:histidine kinase [Streptomyces agglomeratus]OEJ40996.1 two-component sensor histidine kinase [Streptomyces agglomeratus]OEJ44627.1 two-component sensor histidine kinase [Streptomyces agglomeratus]